MKTLYIFRHAKSSWNFNSFKDHDRPLGSRGRKQVIKMGKYLAKHVKPPNQITEDSYCGIYILNRTTGKPMGGISYTDNIREIFSLKLLFDVQVPGILVENDEYHDKSIMADPNLNFWIK